MRADGAPAFLDDYVAAGGYEGLRRVLRELKPEDVTKAVTDSGLRGRGGAGYSTGRKWSTMPLGPDAPHPKYVVCNGDEMEPGSFKDRFLLSRNPHLLVEGMLVAAYAVQADEGYIFLRAQYDEPYACASSAATSRSRSSCTRAWAATSAARRRRCSTPSRASAPIRAPGRRT
jgi:NADH-quinone oxidoreductase subunit F